MANLYHDYETTTYNTPGLAFDPVTGLVVPGSPNPVFIQMILTTFQAPNTKPKSPVVNTIPLMDLDSNLSYGGSTLVEGMLEVPKIVLEGTIDTPMTLSGTNYVPNVLVDTYKMTYPEVIAMSMEGRLVPAGSGYSRVNPRWFRDPFGRVYGDYNNDGSQTRPKILDFRANYLEATPQRMSFSMTLNI